MQQQFLRRMFERYGDELRSYLCRAFGLHPSDAEDIIQTAFVKLTALPDSEVIDHPRAFLFTTVRNLAVDSSRQNKVRTRHLEQVNRDTGTEMSDICSPEQIAIHQERLQILKRIMEKLPPKRRRIFVLNRIHGLSYREIAKEMNLSELTVKRQVFRALKKCHESMARIFHDGQGDHLA